jgi:hypothetical protein
MLLRCVFHCVFQLLPVSQFQSVCERRVPAEPPTFNVSPAVCRTVPQQQAAVVHPQRAPTFVESNPAFQDLSESFKALYKSVFEMSQGGKPNHGSDVRDKNF